MSFSKSDSFQVGLSNKQILKISLPIASAMLVPQINFITNNIFLGRFNEHAFALAGITGVYYLIFGVIGIGLNNGLQALISRRAGANRLNEISSLFTQGVRLALWFSLGGILITYFFAPYVLKHTMHDTQNADIVMSFLRIRIWGLPFLFVYQLRNALLVGINQSKYLIYGSIAETATNVILDYGLIYGKLGMPQLGFNGAAIASVIAEAVGLIVIYFVVKGKAFIKQLHLFKTLAYNAADSKLLLNFSSPLILQYAISIISWQFFYILIEHHGERALAVSNTMRNIFGLFGCFTWAFAATANTMVSNVIGQGKQQQVMGLVWKITRLSLSITFVLFVVLNIFPQVFLKIYGQGEDFIAAAMPVMRIVSSAVLMQSVATIWLNSVTGTGNSRMSLFVECLAIVAYCVYVYIVLEKMNLSITYGWLSEWLYWVLIFVPSFVYMMKGGWKGRKI